MTIDNLFAFAIGIVIGLVIIEFVKWLIRED
jgi:hypothetical protein